MLEWKQKHPVFWESFLGASTLPQLQADRDVQRALGLLPWRGETDNPGMKLITKRQGKLSLKDMGLINLNPDLIYF